MPQISRGQKQKLADLTPSFQLRVKVQANAPGLTFDFSCFGVDASDKLSDDRYFVFYNQKQSPEGALKLESDGVFGVDLSRLPQTIKKLVFVATIDGAGTMANLQSGSLALEAGGSEAARFEFKGSDFGGEKAIMIAEIYFKDVWRFAAVGQGFSGGLDALLKHYGGQESEAAPPPPPPAKTVAPAPPPPAAAAPAASGAVNLKKVALDKKMEQQAPGLVSLAKKATVSLQKAGLDNHTAKVALCLDISGSMSSFYDSGKIQKFAEKVLALGTRFDDDGSIDIFLFGARAHDVGEMTVSNFSNFIAGIRRQYPLEGGTNYGEAMKIIRSHYFGQAGQRSQPLSQKIPIYVMFLTDGQTMDTSVTRQQVQSSSYEPLFWQFMGLGKSKKDIMSSGGGFWARAFASDFAFLEELDTMGNRYVDNANFFSVSDPDVLPDEQLYDLLMSEYPQWVRQAPGKGLLG
ncbi:VWA domain-containing protein [bacterium]|nr:MAG: VWA domain-containing protein [bacterium]